MDIRNRMADVTQLRCHVCQDYVRLILPNGWQQLVYQKAKSEVENYTRLRNSYIATFEKMRDIGINNYTVEDMDVSFISEILHNCRSFIPAEPGTIKAIEQIKEDRNLTNHSGENEDPEEMYLRGLLALCSLRAFVRAVDKFEKRISDSDRLAYRQKYIAKIDTLKETLDEERIELVQRKKDMDRDIQRILQSDNPLSTWHNISKIYMDRYWKIEHNPDVDMEFEVRASDAGVIYAHNGAAAYFALIKKDYDETERRLFMLYNAFANQKSSIFEMKSIIDTINVCLSQGCPLRDGFKELISLVKSQGYTVVPTENGRYKWDKNK